MLKIYLARHGQNVDNANGILNGHRDLPLTELGRQQAEELARVIKDLGIKFDCVYTSPLSRAVDTALVTTTLLGLSKPVVMPSLIERDFGIMTGKKIAEIDTLCSPHIVKTGTVTYFLCPEGAETFPTLLKRAQLVLDGVRRSHVSGSVLLFGHGDFGKMLYCAYYDLDWMECLTSFHFGNSELLLLSPETSPTEAHVFKQAQHNH